MRELSADRDVPNQASGDVIHKQKAVLMSIKPTFAAFILNGSKKYEFRRRVFHDKSVTKVLIYASSPVQKVIGEFEIGKIWKDNPYLLYMRFGKRNNCSFFSMTDMDVWPFFRKYFWGRTIGYAIEVKSSTRYKHDRPLSAYGVKSPPRDFCYVWV